MSLPQSYITIGPIPENGTFTYSGILVQADGKTPIPNGALTGLTLTLSDVNTGLIINGRNQVNALNAAGITIDVLGGTGAISWSPLPADNPIVAINPNVLDGGTEIHEAVLLWSWLDANSRPLQQQRKIFISVEKYSATEIPIPAGNGVNPVTINLGSPGVNVWISSDDRGQNRVGGTLVTNQNGQVVFNLTSGLTYYLWTSSPQFEPIMGQSFIAVGDV